MSRQSIRDGIIAGNIFKFQPAVAFNQVNPVSGTKYTILDTVKNCRIYGCTLNMTFGGAAQATDFLEVHITHDGETWKWIKTTPTTGTIYYIFIDPARGLTAQLLSANNRSEYRNAFVLEGQSIKIEIEQTEGGVSGITPTALDAIVFYGKT